MSNDLCKHCGEPIALRNPSGNCDHLCWPDNLTAEAKIANGLKTEGTEALRQRITELETELFALKSGERVLMPVSLEHARAMHLIAERYINDNAKG